ncbi:MAG TPA: hypothetical protein VKR55_30795 [Bradyrhizobium sp.]|uniref:hypothetical protein n=1 Tax=Bradyrhizobium sp. TaxID=376 RepID=UPI002B767A3C|nr:hypothetical protein [Bradyrhizobium sp.]HLZ06520.1 hypothetical protein [Bradyrhizobium sp.]
MADIQDLVAQISEALNVAAQSSTAGTAENYSRLAEKLSELESSSGQYLRSHTAYRSLLAKLQLEKPLTPDDLKTLRSLIVGDADEYLKYDDDFEQSKAELTRVIDGIQKLQSTELNPETLMHLRVLCREATSALVPTVHYLEQKQRVKNFDDNVHEPLSSDTRRMFARVIEDLAS